MTPKIGYAYMCKWEGINNYYINIVTNIHSDEKIDLHCIFPYESTADRAYIHNFKNTNSEIICLGKLTKEEIINKYPEYFI
ncbi:MAG: hypothetical protein BV457_06440 [Thermoplasmata archaeon M9B1D]|nr:MAG: hypothetical protein BV457_06440 [Thermoplasmata archaeon M9B1D]PNX48211.1 MAG: hypothetical protein BV456_10015 [Thermoplasmata archaeon M8B2D]